MPFSNQAEFDSYIAPLKQNGVTHIPVVRETLADLDTPVSTYLKLADQPFTYLFESVQGGDKWGRYSIIGLNCGKVFKYHGNTRTTEVDGIVIESQQVDNALDDVRSLQSLYRVHEYSGLPDMIGGLVGYFGYETIAYIEKKLSFEHKSDEIGAPDILLMESLNVLVFDNLAGRIFIVSVADLSNPNAYADAQTQLDQCVKKLASSFSAPQALRSGTVVHEDDYQLHFAKHDFEAAVQTCREYIEAGDIMQVVLSQRLSTNYEAEPIDLYRALRTINPSPYMYFLNLGDFHIVGSSPEILVRMEDEKVTVRPIAGTRKRGLTHEQDLALEDELLNDEKELAEHLMLIDLGRNDVGRIADTGSVELTDQMIIERYSHVMHIVSNVEGRVKKGVDAIDVLKATFPAGTVSGAPKIRAMEIIHELEPIKRGIYSGAVGYLGWNGNMDTAIAIRTAVIKDGVLSIQAGAGVVADSVPKYEWKETLNKARAMVKAVELATTGFGF
ncbi:anthranilate synthase component I [Arenicella sp. 4NH20-0111]|uniref:anthranilate synthase component I n=1 Tax=Arenicella sp. 4NH20-0111 TaxID=3127648 RepID=UPI003109208A